MKEEQLLELKKRADEYALALNLKFPAKDSNGSFIFWGGDIERYDDSSRKGPMATSCKRTKSQQIESAL